MQRLSEYIYKNRIKYPGYNHVQLYIYTCRYKKINELNVATWYIYTKTCTCTCIYNDEKIIVSHDTD